MPRQRKRTKRQTRKKDNHSKTTAIDGAWKVRDVTVLRAMGRGENGFVNDDMRRKIWPILLHCDRLVDTKSSTIEMHKDERQAELDILRSFNTYPHGITDERKDELRSQLTGVISHVLRSHPNLHYYQGFHDIASIFLLLFDEKDAGTLMEHVSLFFIRDAMLDSLDPILREITMIDTILQKEDTRLHLHMTEAGVLPYYCLSWVITWFSHDIDDVSKINRLFDLFLSSSPLMPLYVSAALVLSRRNLVLSQPADPSSIHTLLTKVPRNVNIEAWIKDAIRLEKNYPPYELQQLSGVGLDEVSAVNTHKDLWLDMALLSKDSTETLHASRHKADEILGMSADERIPISVKQRVTTGTPYGERLLAKMREMYVKDPMLWTTLLLSAGVVTFAVATDQMGLVR
ncbi:rab-GTPase-TBC domain-containing protein [Fennellomyces sp. T-0311]|nr:rab-GTPase-TBC domain-containing protein [Fennellomyces sp. T-0311]